MTPEQLQATLIRAMPEKELQAHVIDLAEALGWRWYHVHDSRRSPSGFPDLCMCRSARLIFAELKAEWGRTRPDQVHWLNALREAGAETYIWRPSDIPTIQEILA